MQAARGASLTSNGQPDGTRSRLGLVVGIAAAAWLVDLVTKILAVRELGDDPVRLVGSLLQLHLTRNAGAAFSTGTSMTAAIAVFGCVAFAVACWMSRKVRSTAWAWAFGLLLAGIAGNLTDRFFRDPGPLRGHVIDFLELPHWPIFNIADVCINVAAALIVIQSLRGVGLSGHRHTPHGRDRDTAEAAR